MDRKKILIILIALLTIAFIILAVLFTREKITSNELIKSFELDKEDLENEFTRFAQQYDELKLTVTNDSLAVLLEKNK